jgi:hypothetical protein
MQIKIYIYNAGAISATKSGCKLKNATGNISFVVMLL